MKHSISFGVYSEVGRLNGVLLHRPGDELKRLTKTNYKKFLFDSIPCLNEAQKSHDLFAKYLHENNIEVFYVKDLFMETLEQSNEAHQQLIDDIVEKSSHIENKIVFRDWLLNRTKKELVNDIIVGIRYSEVEFSEKLDDEDEFLIPPLPNLFYVRDSFSIINQCVFIWKMFYQVRFNETLIMKNIFQFNRRFSNLNIFNWIKYCDNDQCVTIEGGDIAYLGSNSILIGLSERTNTNAIETLSKTNFFENIFVVKLPKKRVYMHLDMILSQVSRNIFTFHQPLNHQIEIFHLDKTYQWISYGTDLPAALPLLLNRPLLFYDSIDTMTSTNEQLNCRHNVFALNERHVMTYDGDIDPYKSIYTQMIHHPQYPCRVGLIRANGLIDGGGGAHCITNPIARDNIN